MVEGAVLTKDERRIISWGSDELRLWDATTGEPIGHAMKHRYVKGAVLTKDERRILSRSWAELRLWDVATGQQLGPTMKHEQGSFEGALLTKDERRILSWASDGALQLWDSSWPSGNLLELACALLPDREWAVASLVYGFSLTDRNCKTLAVPDWSSTVQAPAEESNLR